MTAKTSTERNREAYARDGASQVRITAETRAHLAKIRARDGDATDRGAVARVVREAAEREGVGNE